MSGKDDAGSGPGPGGRDWPPDSFATRWFAGMMAAAHHQSARYGPAPTAEEAERRRRDHWWELGPVFSTTDRGAGITSLAPGRAPGRFTPPLLAALAGTALLWTAVSYLGLAELPGMDASRPGLHDRARTWWWIGLIVVALAAAGSARLRLVTLTRVQFGRQSVARGLAFAAGALGITAGAALHLAGYASTLADGERFFGERAPVLLMLVTAPVLIALVVGMVHAPSALWRARRRQRLIQRLRDTGRRFDGEVESTRFRRRWAEHKPLFDVVIRYEHAGSRRTFSTAMATNADRVPLPGFPVRIMVDERSATLVEPDVDRPGHAFETGGTAYVKPSDSG
ncbi:hypothetical protein LO763_26770 [Glycomyces sp. A-F 0318]|uniref:hypothetical protein n=1 Tax=Glycomyces amatae TaxID=2881355 RepID=UPI001E5F6E83|nr:hypothetical protein [Glycomyces amatae]MCD0447224.1 hypothetical protein [Glycomyces amatae]